MDTRAAVDTLMSQLGVERIEAHAPAPATITELVNSHGGAGRGGGVRAVAQMLPGDAKIESKMRSVQRYMNAEQHTGKQARGVTVRGYEQAKANLNEAFGVAREKTEAANAAAQAQIDAQREAFAERFPHGIQVTVTGDVHISNKIEPGRTITSDLTEEDLVDLYDAWVEGDEETAADSFTSDFWDNYDVPGGNWDAIEEVEGWL